MTDALAAIQQRIAEIEQKIGAPKVPPRTQQSGSSSALDFASVLGQATAANGATTDATNYGNGRIPTSALTSVGHGEYLAPKAARSFLQMQTDARAAGIT